MSSILRSLRTQGMVFQKAWFKAFSGSLFRKRRVLVESVSGVLGRSSMQALAMLLGEKSAKVLNQATGDFDFLVSGRAYKLCVFSANGKRVFKLWDLTEAVKLLPGREKEILSLVTATTYVTDSKGTVLGISSQWDRTAGEYEAKEIAEGRNRHAVYSSALIGKNFSSMLVGRKSKLFFSCVLKLINAFGKLSKEFWAVNLCQSECRIAQMLHTLYTKTKVSESGEKLFFHDTLNLTAITDLQAKLIQAERIDFGRAYRQALQSRKIEWQPANNGFEPAINQSSTVLVHFIESWLLHGLRGTASIENIQAFVSRHTLKSLLSSENVYNKELGTECSVSPRKKRKLKTLKPQEAKSEPGLVSGFSQDVCNKLVFPTEHNYESDFATAISCCSEELPMAIECISPQSSADLLGIIDLSLCDYGYEPLSVSFNSEYVAIQNSFIRECSVASACFECACIIQTENCEFERPKTTNLFAGQTHVLPTLNTGLKSEHIKPTFVTSLYSAEKTKASNPSARYDDILGIPILALKHSQTCKEAFNCTMDESKESVFIEQNSVEHLPVSYHIAFGDPVNHPAQVQQSVYVSLQQTVQSAKGVKIKILPKHVPLLVTLEKDSKKQHSSSLSTLKDRVLSKIVKILSIKIPILIHAW